MANYGEHSSESQMSRLKRGKMIGPWKNNKPTADKKDWLTGSLSIKDINKHPRVTQSKDIFPSKKELQQPVLELAEEKD